MTDVFTDYSTALAHGNAKQRGWDDMEHGVSKHSCPYQARSKEAKEWKSGYEDASEFWYGKRSA